MEFSSDNNLEALCDSFKGMTKQKAFVVLHELDDNQLWQLYKSGLEDGLVMLFRKYHRQIVVLVYKKLNANGDVKLGQVQDGFGDFIEQVLAGRYSDEVLKKNFTAFSVHHLSYLVRSKMKLAVNTRVERLNESTDFHNHSAPGLHVEEKIDFSKVVDFIPKISNAAYRMVLYLVFIMGYNSKDLIEIFGQREKAYNNRSRALKAFRVLLEKEGVLDELR